MSKSEKSAGLLILKIVGYIAAWSGLMWLIDQPGPSQFLTKHLATALIIAALGVAALGLFLNLRRQIEDQDGRALSLGILALFFLSQSSFRTEPFTGLLMAWLVSLELTPALRAAFKSPPKTKEKPDYPLPNSELFSGPQT